MEIIRGLMSRKIEWPGPSTWISCDQWIQNMRQDPVFYQNHVRSLGEWQAFEDLLLKLTSDHLGRRISLIPFMTEDHQRTFTPNCMSSTMTYHLLYCNKLHSRSFYLSIFPKAPTTGGSTFDLSTMPEEWQINHAIEMSLLDSNPRAEDEEPEEELEDETEPDLSTMTEEEQLLYAIECSRHSTPGTSSEDDEEPEEPLEDEPDLTNMTEEEWLNYAIELSRQSDSAEEDDEPGEQLDDETKPDLTDMTEEGQLIYALRISQHD